MSPFNTAHEALAYLERFTNYEKTPPRGKRTPYDLARMRRLCAALGHPEEKFAAFHVTGTKGKGSTSHYLAAALGAGTGLYTSPHLESMLERIRIGGKPISGKRFAAVMSRVVAAAGPGGSGIATYFELMTAAAFEVFAGCGAGVVEVGLGGRLDATNVLPCPVACGITSIDWDHMDRLGNTLEKIAAEKAGIVKRGGLVVTAERKPGPLTVIRRAAARAGAELLEVGADVRIEGARADRLDRWTATFALEGAAPARVTLATPGRPQLDNFAVAYGMLAATVNLPAVRWQAAAGTVVPGRLQLFPGSPPVLLDVAHNPVSLRALAAHLARAYPKRRTALVFGTSADKDVRGNLESILGAADDVVFTRAAHPRAADPEEMRGIAGRGSVEPDARRAVDAARQSAGKRGLVVVAGSFYIAGEVLPILR
ncbi:MAG: bifunctional folylpolyglutamate synthase/dihydrofolate synthase [Planctomycetes bacterium]|nr:bifunctional folylpolyglutamate synthase/dihydrofolate synthase [Planctomycetota bacterium]